MQHHRTQLPKRLQEDMEGRRTESTLHLSVHYRQMLFSLITISLMHNALGEENLFLDQIQPLLSEKCLQCHGTDENTREGGLRLDQRESALAGGDSGIPAVVPKSVQKSELIRRLITEDESERMPPSPEHDALSEDEIELLSRWIKNGAPYQEHWAFVPPTKKQLDPEQPGHPIDHLVDAKRQEFGLTGSPAATDETLCRRIYLDLIGLPPSPTQVAAFLDKGAATVINELLESPRFGEKWARHWMDVARYSDTNGYEKDLRRDQWIWRDWVIGAINEDMPFDQFIVEQIAGDLLPNSTQEQLVATGFLRNSMLNEEGAIIPEQFRMVEMFDRIDCIGKAVLGMTTQCAQCHSHKYDPISMSEYYGLFAFLNNSYEPKSWVYSDEQRISIEKIESKVEEIENGIRKQSPDWEAGVASFIQTTRDSMPRWEPLRFHDMNSVSGLNHPVHEPDDDSILMLGHTSADVYLIAKPTFLDPITGLQLEVLTHHDLPFRGPGRNSVGGWAVRELEVFVRPNSEGDWTKQSLTNATADFSEPDQKKDDGKKATGPVDYLVDGNDETQWKADRGIGRRNAASTAVVQFTEPLQLTETSEIKVVMRMSDMIGCCRISITASESPTAPNVAHDATLAMQHDQGERNQLQNSAIFTAWRLQNPQFNQANKEIDELLRGYPQARTSVMHLREREGSKQRPTHRLDRGNWDQPQEEVAPNVPSFLHPMASDVDEPDRLRFAKWLTDRRSPLTARVVVNRIWQQIFGVGIVETSEDLGRRTKPPLQQELLDWLAVDLMEHSWSRKHLLRTILNSTTYQQTSKIQPATYETDPSNAFFTRGPRFRADAEVIRDIALSVSGLIHHEMGGPPIIPPVPQNVLDYNYVYPSYWKPATDSQRYRRAVYSFRKRSMPDPSMSSLDAPNADTACVRRVRSNTAMAALTTLNETIFVEASRALAIRILTESDRSDLERTRYAYRLCVSRLPTHEEEQSVMLLLKKQRKRIADGWLNARMITTGNADQLPDLPADITPQDAAAWTVVARVLLNLDETISKN